MRGASENNLECTTCFSSLEDMRTDSFLKKFEGELLTSSSSPGGRGKRNDCSRVSCTPTNKGMRVCVSQVPNLEKWSRS